MSDSGDISCCFLMLVLFGITLLYNGVSKYLIVQKIRNTPTSKVRSAAVGLIELFGKAKCKDEMLSPISKAKCVFWNLHAEYYQSGKHGGWKNLFNKKSDLQFYLEDETGKILIDSKDGIIEIPPDFETTGFLTDKSFFGLLNQKKLDENTLAFIASNADANRLCQMYSGHNLRFVESYIAETDNIYVLGSAMPIDGTSSAVSNENLVVKKGRFDNTFYISDSSEKDLLAKSSLEIPGSIIIGFLSFMIGLTSLLLYFNIF